jgi:hypothetical protein
VLLLLGGIVLVIGLCINVFWVWIVGAAIAVVGLVLFFLWALFCASMTPCTLMWTMECILNWIVKVGLIVAIIVAIIGSKNAACAAGSIAVWGGWGYLDNWLQTIMFKVGCPPIDCTKPRSG